MKYLINTMTTYRVDTVQDALNLREELSKGPGNLTNFSYTTKEIKAKGEVLDSYQLVKAKISFNSDKDPDDPDIDVVYDKGEF